VYIFTEIIITLLIIALLKIPFNIINDLGIYIIYEVGNSFRSILAFSWSLILGISYFIFGLFILLEIFRNIMKNKELNLIEDDRRKDSRIKKKVFNPIIDIVIAFLDLLTVPFVFGILGMLVLLGMNIALLVNGYILVSAFFILLGLLIMLLSVVFAINKITRGGKK